MEEYLKRRLLLIKKLQQEADKYAAEDTEHSRMLALIILDGSIEQLLKVICSRYGKTQKTSRFPELWKLLLETLNIEGLDFRVYSVPLSHLHDLRNYAQHSGIPPETKTIQEMKSVAEEFFRVCLSNVFKIEPHQLNFSSLVRNELVRNELARAEENLQQGNYPQAIMNISKAFESAKKDEQERIWGSGWSVAKGPLLYETTEIPDGQIKNAFDEIKMRYNIQVNILDEELEILKLRLEYKKYRQFKRDIESPGNCGKEKALFCFDFTLNCALYWQTFRSPAWPEIFDKIMSHFSSSLLEK